jgi:CspA family cold shock protein
MAEVDEVWKGVVTAFNPFKGFGFIRRHEGRDVFFFYDDVIGDHDINIGDQVKFTIENAEKGPKAKHIEKLELA